MLNNSNMDNNQATNKNNNSVDSVIKVTFIILIIGLILTFGFLVPLSNKSNNSSICNLGDTLCTNDGLSLKIESITDNESLYYYNSLLPLHSDYIIANKNFLTVKISIENSGKDDIYVSPFDFMLVMEGDYEYDSYSLFTDFGSDIAPMQKIIFQITFETINKSSESNYTLHYTENNLFNSKTYYFKLFN